MRCSLRNRRKQKPLISETSQPPSQSQRRRRISTGTTNNGTSTSDNRTPRSSIRSLRRRRSTTVSVPEIDFQPNSGDINAATLIHKGSSLASITSTSSSTTSGIDSTAPSSTEAATSSAASSLGFEDDASLSRHSSCIELRIDQSTEEFMWNLERGLLNIELKSVNPTRSSSPQQRASNLQTAPKQVPLSNLNRPMSIASPTPVVPLDLRDPALKRYFQQQRKYYRIIYEQEFASACNNFNPHHNALTQPQQQQRRSFPQQRQNGNNRWTTGGSRIRRSHNNNNNGHQSNANTRRNSRTAAIAFEARNGGWSGNMGVGGIGMVNPPNSFLNGWDYGWFREGQPIPNNNNSNNNEPGRMSAFLFGNPMQRCSSFEDATSTSAMLW